MILPKQSRRRVLPNLVAAGTLFFGGLAPGSLTAQDLDPTACFCVRHETGQFRRGCNAFKGPQDFFPTALCKDPETAKSSEGLIDKSWEVVKDGAPGCEVCRPKVRGTPEVPRGDGDGKERTRE
jgi:hypothetical protein